MQIHTQYAITIATHAQLLTSPHAQYHPSHVSTDMRYQAQSAMLYLPLVYIFEYQELCH